MQDSNGNLFGSTKRGGEDDDGVIFEVQPYPLIMTTSLANWTASDAGYNQTISTTGGTGNLTFWASGSLPAGLTLSSAGILSGMPTAAGSYTFTVTATDSLGNSTYETYSVLIYSSDTTLKVSAPAAATAGTPFNLTVTAVDSAGNTLSSFGGIVSLGSSLGPDLTPASFSLTNGSATMPVTLTGAGSQTLTANCAGVSGTSGPIAVGPGALAGFLVDLPGSTLQAGSSLVVTVQAADQYGNVITDYMGPSTVTASISPATALSNFPTTVSINSGGVGLFLATLEQAGSYTISVAGGSVSGSAPLLTVTPGPAAKLAFTNKLYDTPTGVPIDVTVAVEDLYGNVVTSDNSDLVTVSVASGPGNFTADSIRTAPVQSGVATFGFNGSQPHLELIQPDTYQLSALVPGRYTGPNSPPFKVLPLQVLPGSFTGAPWGFSFEFNAPYLSNSVTPALYGQASASGEPPPSVIVTTDPSNLSDTAAYIRGSLYHHYPYAKSVSFIATNTSLEANTGSPLLPDGTYTVIVRSGPINGATTNTGFQALNPGGGFLDGLGTGVSGSGDFTATFTVHAAAAGDDVVWTPASAAGPGQPLNAPGMNQAGGGYPIYLDDHTGTVTSVFATIVYDPTLLTVTSVTTPTYSITANSLGGMILSYKGPALPAGTATPIGFITARVPAGAPYKAEDSILVSGAVLNGGAIPALGDDALHLVAYVGDADGNGAYSSRDAMLIRRVLLQTDSGFAAYPTIDPVIVADTDGSGFIPSDAPLQVNEAGVGLPTANLPIPPVPLGVHFQAAINHVHARVMMLAERRQGQISLPLGSQSLQAPLSADVLYNVDWEQIGTELNYLPHNRPKHT